MNTGTMNVNLSWSGTEALAKIISKSPYRDGDGRKKLIASFERRRVAIAAEASDIFEDALSALDSDDKLEHEAMAMTMHAMTLKVLADTYDTFLDALLLGATVESATRVAFPDESSECPSCCNMKGQVSCDD